LDADDLQSARRRQVLFVDSQPAAILTTRQDDR